MTKLKPFNKIKIFDEKRIKQNQMEIENGRQSTILLRQDTCCTVCGITRGETKLKKCADCGLVVYCSTTCQTVDCVIISYHYSYS